MTPSPSSPPPSGAATAPYSLPTGRAFEAYGGPSRSTQFSLIAAGEIDSFLVGARRYIIIQSWVDYVARQRGKEEARLAAGQRPRMRGRPDPEIEPARERQVRGARPRESRPAEPELRRSTSHSGGRRQAEQPKGAP